MGLCSPDLSVDRASFTCNHARGMSFPVCPQPTSEYSCGFDKLLLLLYPWRDYLLLLDDLVHEVLGGVKEGATGGIISLDIRTFAARDALELPSSDCILDTFVGQRCQTLNRSWHRPCTGCETLLHLLAHGFLLFLREIGILAQGVHRSTISSIGEALALRLLYSLLHPHIHAHWRCSWLRDLWRSTHGLVCICKHSKRGVFDGL